MPKRAAKAKKKSKFDKQAEDFSKEMENLGKKISECLGHQFLF